MYRKSSLLLLIGSLAAVIIVFLSLIRIPSGPSSPSAKGGMPESPLPSGKEGSDRQHIAVSVSMADGQFNDLMDATARFMEQHSNISVELYNVDQSEAYETWKNNAQLGIGADVALMDNEWVREFAVLGYLQPLDDLVATLPANWLNGLLEPVNWNGYWWGLPKDADPLVVAWSRPLLDSLTSQSVPVNWNRFVELAVSAGASAPDVPLVKFDSSDSRQMLVWLDSFPSGERAEMLRPFGSETAQRLSFLATGNGQAFHISRSGNGNPADALAAGKLLSGVMHWSDIEALPSDKRSLLAVGYPNGWYGGRSFVVFAHSIGKDEAIRQWLQAVTGETEQQSNFDSYRLLPSLKPLYAAIDTEAYTASGSRKAEFEWLKQLDAKPAETPDPQWPVRLVRWERIWQESSGSERWITELTERWSAAGTARQEAELPGTGAEAEEDADADSESAETVSLDGNNSSIESGTVTEEDNEEDENAAAADEWLNTEADEDIGPTDSSQQQDDSDTER
ncbi:ABC transporter substrate-binding protein [Paenibacillus kobensis]|uniref:ABC transporter substrate-binding protein n=1 Tax=Paenibacillus kobensis TaxID=59841 RepID=UPI0013E38D5F|nr:extracellular solute-binding protein [Paenibacillus kobensis]